MREAIVALICAVFGALLALLMGNGAGGNVWSVFARFGEGLREISLSGAAGNVGAWAIYAVLCILPLAGLLPIKRKCGWADVLFGISAAYSLWFWRMLANPTRLAPMLVPGFEEVYGAMGAGVLLSMLLGGLLLRLLEERETKQMVRTAERIVTLFAGISGFGMGIGAAGAFSGGSLGLELGYALFLLACEILQTGALVWMLGGASDLLGSVQWGWFDEVNASLSDTLAKRSRSLLLVTVLTSVAANMASLLVVGQVSDSNVMLDLPLTELMAAIFCMLLARFIREGVRIKAENDEFV